MNSERAGATVVISQQVRPECKEAYRAWQAKITAEAEAFDGFEGSETVPPRPGVQDAWVIVYRFRTPGHLAGWITSDVRKQLIAQGEPLFEAVREHVVATPRGEHKPVTVVASAQVQPGREEDYEAWYEGITGAARTFAGFIDSEVFRPVPGVQEEWIVVFRFASAETLDTWLRSEVRQSWLEQAQAFVSSQELQRVGSGLGGWFPRKRSGERLPPDWKQAMAVLLGLYPVVMLLTLYWPSDGLQPAVSMFLNNVVSVALLTWLVMPGVNRLLRRWLAPRSPRANVVGTLAIVAAYGASVALFVALT